VLQIIIKGSILFILIISNKFKVIPLLLKIISLGLSKEALTLAVEAR